MGSCSGCHGATGEGSQGPSLLSGRASRLGNKALFQTIKNGLPGTSMPGFPIADDKVDQVVAFVRSLTAPAIAVRPAGDAARGRSLFFGAAKCSSCHMILNQGGYPGPDLSNIGAERTVNQLTESIGKPSARVEAGYEAVTAVLKSGRTVQGVAKNYNNYSVQVLDRSGQLHLLDRADITKLEFRQGSLMPAMADTGQLRDLVAFLATQATRPYEGESR